jgi:hypothetical protein
VPVVCLDVMQGDVGGSIIPSGGASPRQCGNDDLVPRTRRRRATPPSQRISRTSSTASDACICTITQRPLRFSSTPVQRGPSPNLLVFPSHETTSSSVAEYQATLPLRAETEIGLVMSPNRYCGALRHPMERE